MSDRIHPRDLKVGDTFYECEMGMNLRMIVHTEPVNKDGKWKWTAKSETDEITDYLITEGFEHYGPRIYRSPAYQ